MIPLSLLLWPFRSWRNFAITLLLVGAYVFWYEQHQKDLYNQGYRDAGTSVTQQQCVAQGGHVDGGYCLVP